jgi:hypothetical protein
MYAHTPSSGYGWVGALINAGVQLTATTANLIMSERTMANQRRMQRRALVSQQQQLDAQIQAASGAQRQLLEADLAIIDANIDAADKQIEFLEAQTISTQQIHAQKRATTRNWMLPVGVGAAAVAYFVTR